MGSYFPDDPKRYDDDKVNPWHVVAIIFGLGLAALAAFAPYLVQL
jgi:hypothetical protein